MTVLDSKAQLSEREREVLFLAADGLTDKQIAVRLEIGPKTVRTYWDRIRAKLGASSRTQALALALRLADRSLAYPDDSRLIIETAPFLIVAFDEAHRIVIFNKCAEQVLGLATSEVLGGRFPWHRVAGSHQASESLKNQLETGEKPVTQFEACCLRGDGTPRIVAWSKFASGRALAGWSFCLAGVDVTASKLYEVVGGRSGVTPALWVVDENLETAYVDDRAPGLLGKTKEALFAKNALATIVAEDGRTPDWIFSLARQESGLLRSVDLADHPDTRLTVQPLRDGHDKASGYLIWLEPPESG
jgi:PAS domain S-box-containing protein